MRYTLPFPPVCSFFEWVQNLQNFKWEEEDVNRWAPVGVLMIMGAVPATEF